VRRRKDDVMVNGTVAADPGNYLYDILTAFGPESGTF
jgi:hypothetical protein